MASAALVRFLPTGHSQRVFSRLVKDYIQLASTYAPINDVSIRGIRLFDTAVPVGAAECAIAKWRTTDEARRALQRDLVKDLGKEPHITVLKTHDEILLAATGTDDLSNSARKAVDELKKQWEEYGPVDQTVVYTGVRGWPLGIAAVCWSKQDAAPKYALARNGDRVGGLALPCTIKLMDSFDEALKAHAYLQTELEKYNF